MGGPRSREGLFFDGLKSWIRDVAWLEGSVSAGRSTPLRCNDEVLAERPLLESDH